MESVTLLRSGPPLDERAVGLKEATKPPIIIKVEESPEDESEDDTIAKAFAGGQKHWNDDPVMCSWRQPDSRLTNILSQVQALYSSWSKNNPGAFSPRSDPLWVSTVAEIREAGLPLHSNNINMPEDIDNGWPFHFKEAERAAVVSKGVRVGNTDPAGYVCHENEANHYCIRALQQELRREFPTEQPLLLACKFDTTILRHVAKLLGLEYEILSWARDASTLATKIQNRPVIFAATLCNENGETDDFKAIRRLSKDCRIWVHVDAARNFDYLTTMSRWSQTKLRIPKLKLAHFKDGFRSSAVGHINASTIVAGGMGGFTPAPVVALKPRALGNLEDRQIAYIKAADSTISGSRDSLDPLLMGLQAQRFQQKALQTIYSRCHKNREYLSRVLRKRGVAVQCPSLSLDLLVSSPLKIPEDAQAQLGVIRSSSGSWMATVQPSITMRDARLLIDTFSRRTHAFPAIFSVLTTSSSEFPMPQTAKSELGMKVADWRLRTKDSAGYPFNQAPYTALGPVIGHFLDKNIPSDWVLRTADEILTDRKRTFGLDRDDLQIFGATFTTGSTMGNQIGVHAALRSAPDNFIYVSSAAHYSVTKALMDSDVLSARWNPASGQRFAVIATDKTGKMDRNALVERVLLDRKSCVERGREYGVTLFVTIGTTFTGANDDILDLQQALKEIGQDVSYIHVDGALDFGFSNCGVRLVKPSEIAEHHNGGIIAAQGITLSHHKAYGMMVSGEVICFDPSRSYIPSTAPSLSHRAVFEVWLFQQMYRDGDLKVLRQHSLETAVYVHSRLQASGVPTTLNDGSAIVVVKRPAEKVVEVFGLRCEGDWAHYITMPHIDRAAADRFVAAMLESRCESKVA